MASGVVEIEPIWRAIGAERAKALPAFHAFTGADNTERFSRIGKATWLQVYMKADRDVISSLHMLSTETEVTEYVGHSAWLASSVQSTPPKASTSRPSPSCDGISLQAYGRKWQATSYPWSSETTCPESPYPSQSVGTSQHCSAGSSVGSPAEWLPQGVRWPAETNHDRCPSSSKGHHWDG